jgi:hypothetical protein
MNGEDLAVAGHGTAEQHVPELFTPQARATIRYADAAAWTTAAAIARATADSGPLIDDCRHDVGVAAVSDHGPADTMAQVQANAEQGFSSPLRYAAASPGTLAGVACIAFGFRGPTLNLAMRPRDGARVALLMARAWLGRGTARACILASYSADGGRGLARALLLVPRAAAPDSAALEPTTVDWVAQVDR